MLFQKWKSILVAILLVAVVAVVGTWFYLSRPEAPGKLMSHFRDLEQVEFCTMRPRSNSSLKDPDGFGNGDIEGFAIVDIQPTDAHRELVELLIKADRQNNSLAAKCFDPRHAIRDPKNKDNYLLICFKCYQMRYSLNGETGMALISDEPKRTFNAFISQHSLKTDEGLEPVSSAKKSEVLQPRRDD